MSFLSTNDQGNISREVQKKITRLNSLENYETDLW